MTSEIDGPTISNENGVLIVAFEGWNDAGNAATSAIDHLIEAWQLREYVALDSEHYHDFQVNRPIISRTPSGDKVMSWPGTVLMTPLPDVERPTSHVVVARGIEPSMRWRQFAGEILDYAEDLEVSTVITCGALLIDTPHTRPLPTFLTSEDPAAQAMFNLESSNYEGPTGILGVIEHEAHMRGMTVLSLWAGVPHYVALPPSPKATLALLTQIEKLLGVAVDVGELVDEADAWVRGADELTLEDPEVAAMVSHLESVTDTTDLPEASGDAIAAEFEKYFRKRDEWPKSGK